MVVVKAEERGREEERKERHIRLLGWPLWFRFFRFVGAQHIQLKFNHHRPYNESSRSILGRTLERVTMAARTANDDEAKKLLLISNPTTNSERVVSVFYPQEEASDPRYFHSLTWPSTTNHDDTAALLLFLLLKCVYV